MNIIRYSTLIDSSFTNSYFPYLLNAMLLINFLINSDENKQFVMGTLDSWTCMQPKNIHKMQTNMEKFWKKTIGLGMPKKYGNKCWYPMQCISTSVIHVDVELTAIGISMLFVCLWYEYKFATNSWYKYTVCYWYVCGIGYKCTILQQIVFGINVLS